MANRLRNFFTGTPTNVAGHDIASVAWDTAAVSALLAARGRTASAAVAAIYRARVATVDTIGSLPIIHGGGEPLPAPSASQTWRDVVRETVRSMLDGPEGYWRLYDNGDIQPLDPSPMVVMWSTQNPLTRRRVYTYDGVRLTSPILRVFALDRGPGDLQGLGPMQSDRIVGLLAEQQYSQQFFENSGNPTGVLNVPFGADAVDAEALKAQWDAARNVRTPAVLTGGITWESKAFSPNDSQWVETHHAGIGDVALLFGMPGELLEYAVGGSNLTYTNLGTLHERWYTDTLYPSFAAPIEAALQDLYSDPTIRFDAERFTLADLGTRSLAAYQLVTAGYDPAAVADTVGFPPIAHTGVLPVTVQKEGVADA